MLKALHRWVDILWYRTPVNLALIVLRLLLLPLSALYGAVIFFRRLAYRAGMLHQQRLAVPVVIVGNITVGGTGKTPLVIHLCQHLRAQGFHPGVVIRGYQAKSQNTCMILTPQQPADSHVVGDEAILIARKTASPVAVSRNRVLAGQQLMVTHGCDVIISDDGLQHYALARDIEIAVVDGQRGLGNGYLLPAGPLRETRGRLNSVDYIITNRSVAAEGSSMLAQHDYAYPLQSHGDSTRTGLAYFQQFAREQFHVIAGIGHPEAFFQSLRMLGLQFTAHAFPDHYRYCAKDIDFGPDAVILMTEKDAVKVESFADHRHWAVATSVVVAEDFMTSFIKKLQSLRAENHHGPSSL